MLTFTQAIVSGILLWLGFAPAEFWFAPYFGLALLYHLLAGKNLQQRFYLAFLSGFTFFLLLLHWSSIYVGAAPWLILALGQAALFTLVGLLPVRLNVTGAITFATSFVLIELCRMKFPFGGFGWGRVGFTQIDITPKLYSWIGVTGVSLVIALSGLAIIGLRSRLVFLFFIFCGFVVPAFSLHSVSQIKIAAVQGGVDNLGLDFNNRALSVLNRHIAVTRNLTNVDLIVWPENASDVDPIKNQTAQRAILSLLKDVQIPLVIGAVESSNSGPLNSSIFYNKDGVITTRYVKQDLAPFGEYIPVRKFSERVSNYAREVRDFQPGKTWVRHVIGGIPFQSIICFEVLDDDHIRAGAMGTGFLVAQTNNATFGTSAEAAQQLQLTRARAAELGRDITVVSTTGFSAYIDSSGKIREKAPQFESLALKMSINAVDPKDQTPASKIPSGFWFGFLALVAVLTLWVNRR